MAKTDITATLIEEHDLIKRMLTLLEERARLTAEGRYHTWQFYLDGVDFIRQYADRFHHAKEEDVLFEALVTNGMPREQSPVAAMLMEHEQGRAFVRGMETAVRQAVTGAPGQDQTIADNALGYSALLRDHIDKEDTILYPLVERVLPEEIRDRIQAGYEAARAAAPADFTEQYRRMIEGYEAESL